MFHSFFNVSAFVIEALFLLAFDVILQRRKFFILIRHLIEIPLRFEMLSSLFLMPNCKQILPHRHSETILFVVFYSESALLYMSLSSFVSSCIILFALFACFPCSLQLNTVMICTKSSTNSCCSVFSVLSIISISQ